jgi:hypothetical protein
MFSPRGLRAARIFEPATSNQDVRISVSIQITQLQAFPVRAWD